MKKHILGHVILGLAAIAAFSAAVMLLWNWLIPSVFGLSEINLWQALGLFLLARIFFGGGVFGKHWQHRIGYDSCYNRRFRKEFMKMSKEEKREFIRRKLCEHHFNHDFSQQNESVKHE